MLFPYFSFPRFSHPPFLCQPPLFFSVLSSLASLQKIRYKYSRLDKLGNHSYHSLFLASTHIKVEVAMLPRSQEHWSSSCGHRYFSFHSQKRLCLAMMDYSTTLLSCELAVPIKYVVELGALISSGEMGSTLWVGTSHPSKHVPQRVAENG